VCALRRTSLCRSVSRKERRSISPPRTGVVITTARPCYKLEDLLVGMTPEAMSDVFDWASDKGCEIVE
jgi:antitoxin component of MazEF toxin-antitoxin module